MPGFPQLLLLLLASAASGYEPVGDLALSQPPTQRFLEEPSEATVLRQTNVTFHCTVAVRTSHVLWLKDGISLSRDRSVHRGYSQFRITGDELAGEYHLTVLGVELHDEGRYYCQVSGLRDKQPLVSAKAQLTVLVPPLTVALHPANGTALLVGRPAELQCGAFSAKPAVNVSWIVDGPLRVLQISSESVANGPLVSTTATLRFVPQEHDHGRILRCRVHGPSTPQTIFAVTTLNVVFAPELLATTYPKQAVVENELFTMKCAARANPPVHNWTWLLDGEPLANAVSDMHVIDSVSRSLNGRLLTCVGVNEHGRANASSTIQVRYPPAITNERRVEQVDLHGAATLNCEVDSSPEAVVTWKKVVETVVNGSVKRSLKELISGSSRLLLANVSLTDLGEYVCVADSHSQFPSVSASFHVLRRQPPSITNRGQTFLATRYARTVQLLCSVLSVPRAKAVLWTKDGRVISDHSNVHREEFVGGEHAYLILEQIDSSSFGDYNCTVFNMLGSDSAVMQLRNRNQSDMYILVGCIAGLCLLLILLILLCVIGVYRKKSKRRSPRHLSNGPLNSDKTDSVPSPLVTSIHSAQHCAMHGERAARAQSVGKSDSMPYACTHLATLDEACERDGSWKPPLKEQQSYVGYKEDDFSLMNVSLNNYCLQELRGEACAPRTNVNTVSPLASSSGCSSGSVAMGNANGVSSAAQPPNTPEGSAVRVNGACKFALQTVSSSSESPRCMLHQLGGCSFVMATENDAREANRNSCVMTVLSNPLVMQALPMPMLTLRSDCSNLNLNPNPNPAARRARLLHDAHSCYEPPVTRPLVRENSTVSASMATQKSTKDDKSKQCFYTEL